MAESPTAHRSLPLTDLSEDERTFRQVVREFLSGHPLVRTFNGADTREGGEGATVVQLTV